MDPEETQSSTGEFLIENPLNALLFVSQGLNSEAKALYNEIIVQSEIYNNSNGSYLTSVLIPNLTAEETQSVVNSTLAASSESEALQTLSRVYINLTPSTAVYDSGSLETYSDYYLNFWISNLGNTDQGKILTYIVPPGLDSGSIDQSSLKISSVLSNSQNQVSGYVLSGTTIGTGEPFSINVTFQDLNDEGVTSQVGIATYAGGNTESFLQVYLEGNIFNTGIYQFVDVYGAGELNVTSVSTQIINAYDTGMTVSVGPDASATINGNAVTTGLDGDGANATVTGSNDTIEDFTTNATATATASNSTIVMAGGSTQTLNLYGNNDTIQAWGAGQLNLYGTGETVSAYASGMTISLEANASATINGDAVTTGLDGDGANATVTGSNDTIEDFTTNATATASNSTVVMAGGSTQTLNLYGNNDTIQAWGAGQLNLEGSKNS